LSAEHRGEFLQNPVAGKPELRRYKGIFVVGHDEIGLESDVVEAVGCD